MIAPKVLSVAASTRNWRRMSLRRAPSDFRMPISRVRSATATSMMFMITMPPTTRPIAGSAVPAMVMMLLIFSKNASADCRRLHHEVVRLRRAAVPRWPRSASRTVSMASFIIIGVRRLHHEAVDVAARVREAVQRAT